MKTFDHKNFLESVTKRSGIYQMFSRENKLLYVGKAKNLHNRLSSYFRGKGLDTKTLLLVAKIDRIEVTVTTTEVDALLLENNLIKHYKPPYNILLKDDKSYPYIYLSDDNFPKMNIYRGTKRGSGKFFGPYPNASAVRESLHLLQKVFRIRDCENSYFRNRSRPCLQYQIERCSGPCVNLVSRQEYEQQVKNASLFLKGRSQELMNNLADNMEEAANSKDYEEAAKYRDQIKHLQQVQASQEIEGVQGNLDIIAASVSSGRACIQMLFVRDARVIGSKTFFPPLKLNADKGKVIEAFLPQFYISGANSVPGEIIVNASVENLELISEVLTREAGRVVKLKSRVRNARAKWLQLAQQTSTSNLSTHIATRQSIQARMSRLGELLNLDDRLQRIECFDISHISGEATVGSCVVFDVDGAKKTDYRKFNIEGIVPGDDYAAMEQVVTRRYQRLEKGEGVYPDLLLVDGGKGQVTSVIRILEELSIHSLKVVGVAKGEGRRAGLETLIDGRSLRKWSLKSDDPALHLIQQIRDEAHRFAIAGHRAKRDKARKVSRLDGIPGIGPKRKRDLLRHFGSYTGVKSANVKELEKVAGINAAIATRIYEYCNKYKL